MFVAILMANCPYCYKRGPYFHLPVFDFKKLGLTMSFLERRNPFNEISDFCVIRSSLSLPNSLFDKDSIS